MARKFCKHYLGMHEKSQCEAGVSFALLEHHATNKFMDSCPCFGPEQPGECEKKVYPTPEEMIEDDALSATRIESMLKARTAVIEHCGGKWIRGSVSKCGVLKCPVCEVESSLQFTMSGYNGHIHAKCNTIGCVSWME